jgi:hypothetical protein
MPTSRPQWRRASWNKSATMALDYFAACTEAALEAARQQLFNGLLDDSALETLLKVDQWPLFLCLKRKPVRYAPSGFSFVPLRWRSYYQERS